MAKKKPFKKTAALDRKAAARCRDLLKHNLILLRSLRKISQVEVANAAGMHGSSYNDIECGRVDVRLSGVARIAEALGVPVASLFSEV